MIRYSAIVLPLIVLAGCSGGAESTQDGPVATRPTPTTVLDASPTSNAAVTEPETSDIDATTQPATAATTTSVPSTTTTALAIIEGADSSEDAVSEWFNGIAESDLSRMWAIIDPVLKTDASRSVWDACMAAQFDASFDSLDYEEAEVYTEDGSVFSTGSLTAEIGGETSTQPGTFEVVEREGGWFAVGPVSSEERESCLTQSYG